MKSATVTKQKKLRLKTTLPGDKSVSHRAMMFAALAKGKSVIRNYLQSQDCENTAKIFKALGVRVKKVKPCVYEVTGQGLGGLRAPRQKLQCGNSGTTMRLMAGILSAQPFRSVLVGDRSLSRRPMNRIMVPLKKMGAVIVGSVKGAHTTAPLRITGQNLRGIRYRLPVASAQVKSAILLAGIFSKNKTVVVEPVATRDHTERFLKFLSLPIKIKNDRIQIAGGRTPRAFHLEVPGDVSSASFLMAMGVLVPDSQLELQNILWNPGRTGIIRAIKSMGGNVKILSRQQTGPEKTVDLKVSTSRLRAVQISRKEVPSLIDELPILMVLATQAEGKSWFRGVEELRVKETDRIQSMVPQLRAMGANIGVQKNDIWVQGPSVLQGTRVKSFKDHRTAMSFVVAGMVAQGKTTVQDIDCIKTSFPGFWETLKKAGVGLSGNRR